MRSALLAVNGVARVEVRFEGHEAEVVYDPARCQVEDLIAAVGKAKDPAMPNTFSAAIKR